MEARRHSLDPLFKPRSVAVVGASATTGSVGNILMRNLLANPFGRVVYPVNPKHQSIQGNLCYPSLSAVPEVVDLVVIATPSTTVPDLVQQCVDCHIPAAIILSAGFSELGAEGRQREQELRDVARGRIRILGPNCLGILHPPNNLNASFAARMARLGKVALLSQSGAICSSILDWAQEKHIGFSSFVSVGSMLDVDFADLLDYFADEPHTRSIILYMHSIGNVRKFLSAARSVSRTKQVIVVKSGRQDAAVRAVASHTGTAAGNDAVYDTAFRRAGILRVMTIPDLFSMSEILSLQPPPRGPALAIITNACGPGVMATDALMLSGGQLATLSEPTLNALRAVLPPYWSHTNPIDLLSDATAERFSVAVAACARDPNVDGLLVLLTPQALSDPTATARALVPYAQINGKPILSCWMGGALVRQGKQILSSAGIPTFDSPEAAIRAFLHMVQYRHSQDALYERPETLLTEFSPDADRVRQRIHTARAQDRLQLTEVEAKEVLAAYGLPVVFNASCLTADLAVQAADRIGYPVVLKLLSPRIAHKRDVRGVMQNLPDERAVRSAFEQIRTNLEPRDLSQVFAGVSVSPVIQDKGLELMVGSSIDRQFGPVLLFGAGGVLAEVLQDQALALPPLNRTLARRLIERTRISQALKGVRGLMPVDSEALETLLVHFSQLIVDFPEIQEIEINPLLATPDRLLVLDARLLLSPPDTPPPRLAIPPYPNQYTSSFKLRNGFSVTIRAIRPEDESLIVQLHASHSEQTIRMRFFSLVKTLSRESLIRLCHLDYDREMALAAVSGIGEEVQLLGVSRYYLNPATGSAEFALVVRDAFQRQGLGRHLLQRLIDIARERGVKELFGLILSENQPMLELTSSLGFSKPVFVENGVVRVTLSLAARR